MRPPTTNNKCQLALLVISIIVAQASCKPQQQQQQQPQQFDKHRDRKQQQQVDDQANHLSRTSPSVASTTVASSQSSEISSSSNLFQCPEQFGYYVDPRDCSKYYVCVFGEVLHESCTGGLRFSRELQTCDWPRNVQCPLSSASSSSSSPSSSSSTTPTSTTNPNSFSSSTTPASSTQTSVAATSSSAPSSSTQQSTTAGSASPFSQQLPQEHNGRPSLKNAMVFADEGSDPQQPSFDEAVSPVITPDGAIHLHDGSGGTFSLQAQPNQHHNQPSLMGSGGAGTGINGAASGGNSAAAANVDVFVKPLLAANQNQARSRQAAATFSSQQQQIKPAAAAAAASLSQSQNHQHQSRNNQFNPSSSSSAPSSNEDNNNQPLSSPTNININGDDDDDSSTSSDDNNSNINNNSDSSEDASGANSNNNGADDDSSSIGAQADQELANEQQSGANNGGGGGNDSGGDQLLNSSASDQTDLPSSLLTTSTAAGQQQQRQSSSYIPPVHSAAPPTGIARQAANQVARQSSQLLSVNNLQVNPRNSFRPILVSGGGSSAADNDNTRSGNLFVSPNPIDSFLDKAGAEDESPLASDGGDEEDSLPLSQPAPGQLVSSSRQEQPFSAANNNNNNRPAAPNSPISRSSVGNPQQQQQQQQQARFRQPPPNIVNMNSNNNNNNNQALMRPHQQNTFTQAQPNFKPNQLANNNNLLAQQQQQQQQQNNRQSRMSMQNQLANNNNNDNFQANFQPTNRFAQQPSNSNNLNNNNNNHQLLLHQQLHANNNFMNESKLIKLQKASQFEPLPPVDLPTTAPLNSNNNFNQQQPKHFQQQQQPQLSNSQRSQNVVFSPQQPFGLIADTQQQPAGSNNNNNINLNLNQRPRSSEFQFVEPTALANQNQQQQQQQRRPRPPKRQQIPVGQPSGRTPATATANSRNQLFPEPEDIPAPTGRPPVATISSTVSAPFQPTPSSLSAGGFASSTEAGGPTFPFNDVPDEEPGTSVSPLPASTATSRFQSQSTRTDGGGGGGSSSTTFGAPLATTELTPTTRARGFATLDGVGRDQQVGGQTPRTASQGQQRQPKLFSVAEQPGSSSSSSPPPHSSTVAANSGLLAATGGQQTNLNPNPNPNHHHHLNPPTMATTTTTTAAAAAAATTTATSNSGNGSGVSNQQEQDPQLVANRYLNSAMEAGQPFGAVDYDFEILNDNSTDRRNPPSPASNRTDQQRQPAANNNNLNTQRQRQPSLEPLPTTPGRETSSNGNENGQDNDETTDIVGGSRAQPSRPLRGGAGSAQRQQPAAAAAQQPVVAPTTKKPRPTNKKIQVNHEQALANNRASMEPAKRPESLFATPNPLQTATKCDTRQCRLPDCKCGDTLIPGALDAKQVPQVVLLTFDDAVNDLNWEIYEELFTGRTNPNGCPILATFYVSHEWTDYGQVQTLYSRGHEMASHSITHSFGEKFSKHQWFKEVNGQREILNLYGGVKMNDVRGMRAPFLQIGGNKMFEMLYDANFTYDSSMPIFENLPPLWPYTLDYQLAHECMITPCPTKSFPGVWEVGMTMWVDLRGGRCSMGDACSNPSDEDGVYEMLMKNFNRHYKSNRAPFGLFYHSAWFNTVHHRRGFLRFLSHVNSLPDVFFTTNWQMLQWMRNPTPLSEINQFEPWQCPAKNDRPPPCYHPSVCNVKSEHGTRFMKTCQPCPTNQQYPWVGARDKLN